MSKGVNVVIDLEGGVALVLEHLLLGKRQVSAHLGHVEAVL